MADTSIYNILIDALATQLSTDLIDGVPDADSTQAGVVRAGKLQDDPTDTLINVLIHEGRPDSDPHVLNTYNTGPEGSAPTYQVGGGTAWYRNRFEVELKLFFDGDYDRAISRNKANVVLSRAKNSIMTLNLQPLARDTFGEKAHFISVYELKISEGGGQGTFIWRGNIKLEVLCDQEFV